MINTTDMTTSVSRPTETSRRPLSRPDDGSRNDDFDAAMKRAEQKHSDRDGDMAGLRRDGSADSLATGAARAESVMADDESSSAASVSAETMKQDTQLLPLTVSLADSAQQPTAETATSARAHTMAPVISTAVEAMIREVSNRIRLSDERRWTLRLEGVGKNAMLIDVAREDGTWMVKVADDSNERHEYGDDLVGKLRERLENLDADVLYRD
ncbi:MAG: hypothetical protein CSB44_01345 [Gammaproteobacteria bacterium]|nr:MAG: hypothetical protein CSB44_01345 [Gammaproteobacteria bacterium]